MRALVQRVTWAQVTVGGEVVGRIGPGLCVLLGVTHDDDTTTADRLAAKVWTLRVFDDAAGRMNRSLADTWRTALVVSQFTLYGESRKGRRPSWVEAARPEVAEPLVERFIAALTGLGATVASGRFRTRMQVALENDGPVTLLLDLPAGDCR